MKKSIERFRNWVTTGIGLVLILVAIAMFVMGKFKGYEFTTFECASVLALGWVFLNAKDSLIEGMFLSIFKLSKPKEDESPR